MKLYNSQLGKEVKVADHIGAKMLKHNHVKNGGIYSTIAEVPEYFDTEAVAETGAKVKTTPKKAAPETGLHTMNKPELVKLAVKKLDIPEAQAKALKKDELIAALEK